MIPFSSFLDPGVWEGLLQGGLAPEEGSSMRAEADVGGPRQGCCPSVLSAAALFLSLSGPQLISFTGVPIKLAQ